MSPDGVRLLFGSGARATFWDIETGERLVVGEGHEAKVWRCAFGPDGSWAVTSSDDGTLKVWDVENGEARLTLVGHKGRVNVCAISPDGTFIVSGGADSTVRIWDAENASEQHLLEGHTGEIWGCAVSPDRKFVLSSSWDRTLRVWNASSGREEMCLDLPKGVHGLTFHPAKPLAVCGDHTGWVHFIELVGLERGPIVVTPRDADGTLFFRCPGCWRNSQIDESGLGRVLSCSQCGIELRLNPFTIRSRARVASSDAERQREVGRLLQGFETGSRDEELLRATKTCSGCGYEVELLRYACPRCGNPAATPSSHELAEFMQMRQRRASLHVDRGGLLFQQGRYDEAEEEFHKAIEANPWNATAHGNLAVVMLRRGRLEEGIHWFEKALEIDPRVPGGQQLLAQTREKLGRRGSS